MTDLFTPPPRKGGNWRTKQGHDARNAGVMFERTFQAVASFQGCEVTKFPDGCKQVGRQLIRVKMPFDFVVSADLGRALLDTKHTDGKSFRHSKIDVAQADILARHEKRTRPAGYVVELQKVDTVIFIPARVLIERVRANADGSITPQCEGVVTLGTCSKFDVRKIFG